MSQPAASARPDGRAAFRLAGIPVFIPPSGILGIVLIAWLWAPAFAGPDATADWVTAAAFGVLLALATLVHEMSHALAARALGYPVQAVVLHLLGGRTHYHRTRQSPGREAVIAAAGPVATFAVAGLATLAAVNLAAGTRAADLAVALAWANLIIGVYNALPGLPLDGGMAVRAVVWAATGSERTGTLVAGWAGRALAVLTLFIPILLAAVFPDYEPDLLSYVFCGVMAGMIYAGASAQMRSTELMSRAEGLTAGGLARRAFPVQRDLPLAEAIRRAVASGAGALVVVDHEGRPLGIGQQDAIAAVPEARRPWLSVAAISRTLDSDSTIGADVAGSDLLVELARRRVGELLVLDPSGLAFGVLLRSDVEAALRSDSGR